MKNNYKLLLTFSIITCLIAFFFLGKWINEIKPYWEIKEGIYTNQHCFGHKSIKNSCCEISNCSKTYRDVEEFYCDEESEFFDNLFAGTCYIKEKVRIK